MSGSLRVTQVRVARNMSTVQDCTENDKLKRLQVDDEPRAHVTSEECIKSLPVTFYLFFFLVFQSLPVTIHPKFVASA